MDTVFQGDEGAYDTAQLALAVADAGMHQLASDNMAGKSGSQEGDNDEEASSSPKSNASNGDGGSEEAAPPATKPTTEDADKGEAPLSKTNGEGSQETGTYIECEGSLNSKVSYDRPSGFRKGVRDKVWDNAKNSNGDVIDPVTKKVMDKSEPWDMGHKPGYEFRKHKQSAENRGISRKQFLDEYNNPEHYRPELPSSNRSHKGEDITDNYFGD